MNRIAGRAGICLLLVLALLSGLVFFLVEYAVEAGDWVIFAGSPHVYNGGNIGCGTITDRDGVLLLDLSDQRAYAQDESVRKSTVHWLGDRKGNIDAPALSAYASELAGFDLLNGIYSYGKTGGDAELTLSAAAQSAALEAMGSHKGTIGIYNYKTGELLCAVTTPNYDPDNAPDIPADDEGVYEGLYLNRFTQSTYIPGSIFKIVTLAAALESIPDIQQQRFVCKGSYQIGNDTVTCDGTHWEQDLKTAFRNSCNCAFAQIAQQLGNETLQRYVETFGVTRSVTFDGITTASGNFNVTDASELSLAWSSIGQYTDLVNPCAYLTFLGGIAAGGKGVSPYLVQNVKSDGITTYSAQTQSCERIMSASTAETVREFMGFNVSDKYGSENFPGLTVCAKTGTAEVGGDKKPNAMLAGFVADEQYPLAFIVAVEDGGYGREICVPILSKVLMVCKTVLDGNGLPADG
jgi:peptidoglycan glycosyltransferase